MITYNYDKILKRVKHFTHTDLDGVGCAVLSNHVFSISSVSYCDYNNVNEKITRFINIYLDENGNPKGTCEYDLVLITDISVNRKVASLLDRFIEVTETEVILLDHHNGLDWLSENHSWATIKQVYEYGLKTSGTSLMITELLQTISGHQTGFESMKRFAESVRLYDTWDWKAKKLMEPKNLNDLLHIIGRNAFMERFTKDISTKLSSEEQNLLDVEKRRIGRYINSKMKELNVFDMGGYTVGAVFAESNHSELGNTICEKNNYIDYAMIINVSKMSVSLRTTKDIDLSSIAKKFGGGGHKAAAGFELSSNNRSVILNDIVDRHNHSSFKK